MKRAIHMIAMDMDGTLLRSDETISERTIEALHAARKQGVTVALCTGRFAQNGAVTAQKNGLTCDYVIASNGCMLWDEHEHRILREHTIAPASVQRAFEIIQRYPSRFNIVSGHLVTDSETVHPVVQRFSGDLMDVYQIHFAAGREALQKAIAQPVYKLFMYRFEDMDKLAQCAAELHQVPDIYLTQSGERNLEVMPVGVDKGTGVTEMAQMLEIDMEDVMVFGDFDNDIPMFEKAGFPVAMGNANEKIKRLARYVTDDHDHDGIAKAVEKFVLNH